MTMARLFVLMPYKVPKSFLQTWHARLFDSFELFYDVKNFLLSLHSVFSKAVFLTKGKFPLQPTYKYSFFVPKWQNKLFPLFLMFFKKGASVLAKFPSRLSV